MDLVSGAELSKLLPFIHFPLLHDSVIKLERIDAYYMKIKFLDLNHDIVIRFILSNIVRIGHFYGARNKSESSRSIKFPFATLIVTFDFDFLVTDKENFVYRLRELFPLCHFQYNSEIDAIIFTENCLVETCEVYSKLETM